MGLGNDSKEALLTYSYSSAPSAPPPYEEPSYNPRAARFAKVPPELKDNVDAIRSELKKIGISETHEARVCLVLDTSSSMQEPNQFFYDTQTDTPGPIYDLLKKAISTAMVIDDNQVLEIFPFGETAREEPLEARKDNYATIIEDEILANPETDMQQNTNYAAVMRAVRAHYFGTSDPKNPKASHSTPVFLIFVTDGEPNMEKIAAAAQFRASSYQPIFCKIIALKGKTQSDFTALQNLDDAPTLDEPGRKPPEQCNFIDNCDFVVLNNPAELTTELLFREYPQWLLQAQQPHHGHTLLTADQGLDPSIVKRRKSEAGRVGEKSSCCNIL